MNLSNLSPYIGMPAYRIVRKHDIYIPQWRETKAPWWRFWNRELKWHTFERFVYDTICDANCTCEEEAYDLIDTYVRCNKRKNGVDKIVAEYDSGGNRLMYLPLVK